MELLKKLREKRAGRYEDSKWFEDAIDRIDSMIHYAEKQKNIGNVGIANYVAVRAKRLSLLGGADIRSTNPTKDYTVKFVERLRKAAEIDGTTNRYSRNLTWLELVNLRNAGREAA